MHEKLEEKNSNDLQGFFKMFKNRASCPLIGEYLQRKSTYGSNIFVRYLELSADCCSLIGASLIRDSYGIQPMQEPLSVN